VFLVFQPREIVVHRFPQTTPCGWSNAWQAAASTRNSVGKSIASTPPVPVLSGQFLRPQFCFLKRFEIEPRTLSVDVRAQIEDVPAFPASRLMSRMRGQSARLIGRRRLPLATPLLSRAPGAEVKAVSSKVFTWPPYRGGQTNPRILSTFVPRVPRASRAARFCVVSLSSSALEHFNLKCSRHSSATLSDFSLPSAFLNGYDII
jgi:hypothetical protein